jgi:hypothetical protein
MEGSLNRTAAKSNRWLLSFSLPAAGMSAQEGATSLHVDFC